MTQQNSELDPVPDTITMITALRREIDELKSRNTDLEIRLETVERLFRYNEAKVVDVHYKTVPHYNFNLFREKNESSMMTRQQIQMHYGHRVSNDTSLSNSGGCCDAAVLCHDYFKRYYPMMASCKVHGILWNPDPEAKLKLSDGVVATRNGAKINTTVSYHPLQGSCIWEQQHIGINDEESNHNGYTHSAVKLYLDDKTSIIVDWSVGQFEDTKTFMFLLNDRIS